MKIVLMLTSALLLLAGCATELSKEGATVKVVSESERDRYNCKLIKIVTSSNKMSIRSDKDAEGAINEARNKTAKLGGNGMRVMDIDSSDKSSTVTAEALKCEFGNS